MRFPVFVPDGRGLAPQEGPIEKLSKYQSPQKEKCNHRAANFVISKTKSHRRSQSLDLGQATIDITSCGREIGLIGRDE